MIHDVGIEFDILLDVDIPTIEAGSTPAIAEAVRRMRIGDLHIRPGYDGVYGEVHIYSDADQPPAARQQALL